MIFRSEEHPTSRSYKTIPAEGLISHWMPVAALARSRITPADGSSIVVSEESMHSIVLNGS